MTSTWVQDLLSGRAVVPPAARLLGLELLDHDAEAMTIEVAFTARDDFLNTVGHVQGGILCAMLDATMGAAVVATLGQGEWAPTTDLHAQFHAPARVGRLVGRGRVTRRGGSLAFLAGELTDPDDVVVASAIATAAIRRRA